MFLFSYIMLGILNFALCFAETSHCESIFSKQFGPKPNQPFHLSLSGSGSDLDQTSVIRREIPKLLEHLNCRILVDAPCGDFFWMSKVDFTYQYIGCDVIRELIAINQVKYSSPNRQFIHIDFSLSPVPYGDVILCRDCLVHLSYEDIMKALKMFKRSGSKYLLTTTFPSRIGNRNIATGDWRPINLCKPPFNFPDPIFLINENCSELDGQYRDKSLGLWNLSELFQTDN